MEDRRGLAATWPWVPHGSGAFVPASHAVRDTQPATRRMAERLNAAAVIHRNGRVLARQPLHFYRRVVTNHSDDIA
jgi:hypothetical protein